MRPRIGFDVTIGVLGGMGLVLNAVELLVPSPWGFHVLGISGVFGVLLLYRTMYRPVLPAGCPRPWWASVLLVLAVGTACAGFTPLMPLQIAAHVMVWATAGTAARAVTASAAVSAAAYLGVRLGELGAPAVMPPGAIGGMSVLAFLAALGYGFWIRQAQRDANEQAALVEELRATRDALTAASRHAGQMEERARVSRELHDTLTQSVAALALVAAQARRTRTPETLDLLHEMAQDALREARGVLSVLAPVPTQGDASRSVEGIAARFRRETSMPVEVDAAPVSMDAAQELVIIRCLQEGLSNVRRHARASRVLVRLRGMGADAELVIEDDGIGIAADAEHGFGLRGMQERAEQAGGVLEVGRGDGGGTRLRVRIPALDGQDDQEQEGAT
ncbi:sensor histidine kinase [Brachybacterium hainanense]|uniref:Sensor histidine kinase n=1 Tax=Brachybacterium hainanense TaxID=1541174 RepID=A0ABV6RHD0_9MICO